jgi:hypothetical protein
MRLLKLIPKSTRSAIPAAIADIILSPAHVILLRRAAPIIPAAPSHRIATPAPASICAGKHAVLRGGIVFGDPWTPPSGALGWRWRLSRVDQATLRLKHRGRRLLPRQTCFPAVLWCASSSRACRSPPRSVVTDAGVDGAVHHRGMGTPGRFLQPKSQLALTLYMQWWQHVWYRLDSSIGVGFIHLISCQLNSLDL